MRRGGCPLRSSSLDSKTNPPYPPLTGGQEKSKPPQPGRGALPFYTPLTRGGRGGCSFDEIFQQPRPLENDPHFPAIAVTPETADCGIVRATRGSGFSPVDRCAGRGGFLMGCGDGAGVRAVNPSGKSSIAPSPVAFDTRSPLAPDLLRGAFSRRGVALMDSRMTAIMKIMIFPVNFDKFTVFFDKFLKIYSPVSDCKTNSYHKNLSAPH